MSRPPDPAPVFVVGAPRSGARLLAWGLAEHPRFVMSPAEGWISDLAASLGPVARKAAAVDSPPFHLPRGAVSPGRLIGAVGGTISELLGDADGLRWVDGAPENALHMWGISRLLPHARFIHVIRGVDEVVHHLTSSSTPHASYYTADTATEAWLRYVEASLRAEAALGAGVVHRVLHRDLVRRPRRAVSECLEFLGEPWCEACLRPVRGVAPEPGTEGPPPSPEGVRGRSRIRARAEALTARLLADAARGRPEGGGTETDKPFPILPQDARRVLDEAFLLGTLDEEDGGRAGSPVHRIRALVRLGVPEGSTVAVVSRGDEELVRLPGRQGWHFPQTPGGVYAGHHPADSAEAVAHLETVRTRGAEYLLVPCTAYWWLDHYDGLRRHLDTRARLVAFEEHTGSLFSLSQDLPGHQHPLVRTDASPGAPAPANGPARPTFEEFR